MGGRVGIEVEDEKEVEVENENENENEVRSESGIWVPPCASGSVQF